MIINIWIAIRNDAQTAITTRLNWDTERDGPYTGQVTDREARVFEKMIDRGTVSNLFRKARIGTRDWSLWNIYFDEPVDILRKLREELDALMAKYPTQFAVVGAWHFESGEQIRDTQGDIIYPIHARVIDFMPDVDGARPTIPTDQNILMGQALRSFS